MAETILNVSVFLLRFLWWGAKWSAATVFFLAIMAATGWYVFNRALAGGDYVTVPNIQGKPITEAIYAVADQGLEIGEQTERPSSDVPKFHVITQRPAPGKVVRKGRKVYPTVSVGLQLNTAPNLVGRTADDAESFLATSAFQIGTRSHVPNDAPPNTVLAQDPAPGRPLAIGAAVNLLLSGGSSGKTFYMPDLVGKSLQEVIAMLAEKRLRGVANRVDRPGEPFDVVLDQRPVAGSQVREGDTVNYDVRASDASALPEVRRKVEVIYTVPPGPEPHEVRIDFVDKDGVRRTAYPREDQYVNGQPPKLPGNTPLPIRVSFSDQVTIEVYLDGVRARSYYFAGEAEPVVTDHGNFG